MAAISIWTRCSTAARTRASTGRLCWTIMIFAFAAGMLAGLVTGILHPVLGIPDILSGILTQIALYSVNMNIMGRSNQAVSVDKYNLVVSLRYIPAAIVTTILFLVVIIGVLYWSRALPGMGQTGTRAVPWRCSKYSRGRKALARCGARQLVLPSRVGGPGRGGLQRVVGVCERQGIP